MKTCELCKAEFDCGTDYACWCMDMPVVDVPTYLQDCLCPTCLKEIHDQKTRRTVRLTN